MAVPVSLHNFSEYSFHQSTIRVQELPAAASKARMESVGLTDRNSLAGLVPFFQACAAQTPAIHPVVGVDLEMETGGHLLLLAQSDLGYANLCELLTRHTHDFQPIRWRALEKLTDGLLALSGDRDGQLAHFAAAGRLDEAATRARQLAKLFPERFYIELYHHRPADSLLCQRLYHVAKQTGLPVVAGGRVQYLHAADRHKAQVLASIGTLTLLDEPAPGKLSPDDGGFHFPSVEELTIRFSAYENALENTCHIAQRCQLTRLQAIL